MMFFAALLLALSPLEEAVVAIRNVPECRPLLAQVEREGGFRVIENREAPFGALWNPNRRTIEVNPLAHESIGKIIVSVLFELHNALSNERMKYLQDLARERRISKECFVRKMEQREWKNQDATRLILEAGRQRGIFPADALTSHFRNFAHYLSVQQRGGHTQYHCQTYDLLN